MSNKKFHPSPFPFPMKNNGGNYQQHSYKWFMDKENNTLSGGNEPEKISVVQFTHHGTPSVITGTNISKNLTDKFVIANNDSTNDYWATKGGGKKKCKKNSRKYKKTRNCSKKYKNTRKCGKKYKKTSRKGSRKSKK